MVVLMSIPLASLSQKMALILLVLQGTGHGVLPMPFQTHSRVEYTHTATGDDQARTLEDHERNLVIGKVTAEPAVQFGRTKDRSNEDEESCNSNA